MLICLICFILPFQKQMFTKIRFTRNEYNALFCTLAGFNFVLVGRFYCRKFSQSRLFVLWNRCDNKQFGVWLINYCGFESINLFVWVRWHYFMYISWKRQILKDMQIRGQWSYKYDILLESVLQWKYNFVNQLCKEIQEIWNLTKSTDLMKKLVLWIH